MTSCCHPHQMPWSGATGAIARCKRVSTGCGRKSRSVRVLRWICGVKLKPKAVNKPLPYFIVHELDKPGGSATVSEKRGFPSPIFVGTKGAFSVDKRTSCMTAEREAVMDGYRPV